MYGSGWCLSLGRLGFGLDNTPLFQQPDYFFTTHVPFLLGTYFFSAQCSPPEVVLDSLLGHLKKL
jgi:hypothetical protein